MSITTLFLYLSLYVNSSLLFPTEHQLTTYGVHDASSTSQLTATLTAWMTPESSITCTCSINTTNPLVNYHVNIPAESLCNPKTKENCFHECGSMLYRTIFNVQSESVYSTNITDGVDFVGYLCGLRAKGVDLPFIVLDSKMECTNTNEYSRAVYGELTNFSLPLDYYCQQTGNSNVDSVVEIVETTTTS